MGYALMHLTACAPSAGDDEDEDLVSSEEGEDEPEETEETVAEVEEPEESESVEQATVDDPEEAESTLTEEPPPTTQPIAALEPEVPQTPPPQQQQPAYTPPANDNPPPAHIAQEDLRLQCKKIGSGLNPGFIRYGCNALTRDGTHYGVVKGWWHAQRRDGSRAKSKDLNFREGGFDLAIDVLEEDARTGFVMRPGQGELPPLRTAH
jgi:hypothetical protein